MADPLNILLIEDNPDDVDLLKIALSQDSLSVRIDVCEDGEKAIQYLYKESPFTQASKPNIIVMDLNLPKKSGWEVLQEIQKNFNDIPVLIMTTLARQSETDKLSRYKKVRFFIKPSNFSEYRNLINLIREMAPPSK